MDGQYWKGDRTMSINEWLLTSDFWQFLEPWHGRWYEYEIFIASCTDNIYDLENETWLLGDMIDHVGIYGSRVAEGLSAFNVGLVNSLWPSDVIWRHRAGSTLVQVMAWCRQAPSHYLNQCWLIISNVLWHSCESIFLRRSDDNHQKNKIENCIFEITSRHPREQWVNVEKSFLLHFEFWYTTLSNITWYCMQLNSLAPGRFEWHFREVIFKLIFVIDGWDIPFEIAIRWLLLDLTDDQSTLVQVMAWCHEATSHYLSQCWPRSVSPYAVTRPQWVNQQRAGPPFTNTV